jgi:undecaprenyl diphosphate synthase
MCIDYGGRDEIVRAIEKGAKTEGEITKILTCYAPEPDVILRTGGQKRLSNFLLW